MGFFRGGLDFMHPAAELRRPGRHDPSGEAQAKRDGVAAAQELVGTLSAEHQKTVMLMASGIAGQARIDEVSDTGTTVNDNPRVQFDLTVTVPGRDPYTVRLAQVVSRMAIGNFQPGATVAVKISPEDPQTLMIA